MVPDRVKPLLSPSLYDCPTSASVTMRVMVVLTHSDVRAYCLGIAQIIPVLMIALFVVDSGRFVQIVETSKGRAQKVVDLVNDSLPEQQQKASKKIAESIEQLDSQIFALDRIDWSQAGEEATAAFDIIRRELVESRDRQAAALERLNQLLDVVHEGAARMAERKEKLDSSARKVTFIYAYGVTLGIVLAVAGEVIALWGAIGLISGTVSIACITDVAIVLAASLGRYAIERIIPMPTKHHVFNMVQYCWIPVILFAQFTFVWILINVRLHS